MGPSSTAYFLAFCIEQYKKAKGLTGLEAMERLHCFGVLDYLAAHYEVLHTQSSQWLMEEIDDFIEKRREEER